MFTAKEKTIIYEAFDLYYKEYCKTLPTKEELSHIVIPDELEKKIQKLIAKERKFYYYWINTLGKRVAAIILAIILCLTTVTFSVRALREPVVRFIVETFEKFSKVIFINDKSEDDVILETDDFVFDIIDPMYIPAGYELESEYNDEIVHKKVYINNDLSTTIVYMQRINDESIFQANTEGIVYENISISKYQGVKYSNKGNNTVMFNTDDYIFMITGQIEESEIIKIAESIEIK